MDSPIVGGQPVSVQPANSPCQLSLDWRRWGTPLSWGKPFNNTAMLPASSWRISESHPHCGEDRVIATGHTHIVPSLLCREHGCLVVLKGDSPQGLLALGVHYVLLPHCCFGYTVLFP